MYSGTSVCAMIVNIADLTDIIKAMQYRQISILQSLSSIQVSYNRFRSTGQEEVKKVKKSKKKTAGAGEEEKPSEKVRTGDGALVVNYELPQEEEEVVYHGGVRGIRALR